MQLPFDTRTPYKRIDDLISAYKESRVSADKSPLIVSMLLVITFGSIPEFSEEASKLIQTQILKQ